MKRSSTFSVLSIACIVTSLGIAGMPSQAANTSLTNVNRHLAVIQHKVALLNNQVATLKKSSTKNMTSVTRSMQSMSTLISSIEAYAYWPARQLVANNLSTVQDALAIVECKKGTDYAYGTAFAATSNVAFPAADYQNGIKTVLLTALHVVNGCDTLTLYPYIAQSLDFPGTVLHKDSGNDIAAIGIPYTIKQKLSPSPDYPSTGSFIMASGFGGEFSVSTMSPRIAVGNVESVETDYLVTDATTRTGFSGGPVVDWNGDWVGITTGLEVDDNGAMTPLARVPHTVCLLMYNCNPADKLLNW